jgi:hypothetical protein
MLVSLDFGQNLEALRSSATNRGMVSASTEDFEGDFASKPGSMYLAEGEKRRFVQRIAID